MYEVRFVESEAAVVYAGKGATVPTGYVGSLAYTGVIDQVLSLTFTQSYSQLKVHLQLLD